MHNEPTENDKTFTFGDGTEPGAPAVGGTPWGAGSANGAVGAPWPSAPVTETKEEAAPNA